MAASALGFYFGGPLGAAAASGLTTYAKTGNLAKGLFSGMTSYGLGSLTEGLSDVGAAEVAKENALRQNLINTESAGTNAYNRAIDLANGQPTITDGNINSQFVANGTSSFAGPEPMLAPVRPADFAYNPYSQEGINYMRSTGLTPENIATSAQTVAQEAVPTVPMPGKDYKMPADATLEQRMDYMNRGIAKTAEGGIKPFMTQYGKPLAIAGLGAAGSYMMNRPQTGVVAPPPNSGNIRPYTYNPGAVNPNFGQRGQSYYLGQGYTALPIYAAAEGGIVPSPNDNAMYPMSNLATGKAGFNVQSSPTANEVVGGYDAQIDPFTGAQKFATGGLSSTEIYPSEVKPDVTSQIKGLSNSQLDLVAEESDDPIMQGEAVKERYLRGATQRTPKSAYTKGMAGGGFLGIGGSGGEITGTVDPNSLLGRVLGPAGRQSSIHEYGYNPADQSYTDYGYDVLDENGNPVLRHMAMGGIASLPEYAAGGKLLRGAGDGMSDDIPAVIKGAKEQRAALADGEFVVPADVVSHLGNGSTEAGAKRLYSMMSKVRKARTGNPKQGKQIQAEKYMPA
jgi:hypothetical protein